MARMLDAVSGSAESSSTSEQRADEHNPQPYRVGFEQCLLGSDSHEAAAATARQEDKEAESGIRSNCVTVCIPL
jgi:hypothetical protein